MKYQKNEIVRLAIRDIGKNGEGIGSADGLTVFVRGAVVGDEIEARLTKVKKHYAYARLERILRASDLRTEPRCEAAGPCGGCQLQHMEYEAQLRIKEQMVQNALTRIGGFKSAQEESVRIEPICGMEHPWHYRNKAQFPVGNAPRTCALCAGYYATHSHRIIPLPEQGCAIGTPWDRPILSGVLGWMRAHSIPAYEEERGSGLVRHILIRTGHATGEILVCLVVNGTKVPHADDLIRILTDKALFASVMDEMRSASSEDEGTAASERAGWKTPPHVVGITYNINQRQTNVILGDEVQLLWGEAYLTDRIGDVTYRISPQSFYQINPIQTEKLYQTALDYAGLTGEEIVWDLYCGTGTISLFLAQMAKRVIGVEIVPRAVKDARENAARNSIRNAEFHVGKAEDIARELYRDPSSRADVVVVDPPRKGCDAQLLSLMLEMEPERIVYVSCDPATLARDLRILADGGYRIERVQPVDMFPHAMHIESVVSLIRAGL